MKKFIVLFVIASAVFIACNDPKDPPDDSATIRLQQHADSLAKVDSLNKQ